MITSLYLIRHGATAANEASPYRLQGRRSDLRLSDVGLRQAEAAANELKHMEFDAIYTSPLMRAVETATTIAAPHGRSPRELAEVIEADVGRWEGLSWEDARLQDPEHHAQFMKNPGTVPYPDGESFQDALNRGLPALARLAERHAGGTIAVVAHNIINRAVLAGLLGVPIDRARLLRQANACINLIEYGVGDPQVVTINACMHIIA